MLIHFILNQPDHQYSAMITGFLQKRHCIINCLGITAISIYPLYACSESLPSAIRQESVTDGWTGHQSITGPPLHLQTF